MLHLSPGAMARKPRPRDRERSGHSSSTTAARDSSRAPRRRCSRSSSSAWHRQPRGRSARPFDQALRNAAGDASQGSDRTGNDRHRVVIGRTAGRRSEQIVVVENADARIFWHSNSFEISHFTGMSAVNERDFGNLFGPEQLLEAKAGIQSAAGGCDGDDDFHRVTIRWFCI